MLQVDHLGNIYKNRKEMCEYYGIGYCAYISRIELGWSVEKALTTPVKEKQEYKDHLGNIYSSEKDMCDFYKIPQDTYRRRRIKQGLSIEEALTAPISKKKIVVVDHLGNIYSSQRDMCKHYGISDSTYIDRIKRGWSISDALSTPSNEIFSNKTSYFDHTGKSFATKQEMCAFYNIHLVTFNTRIKRGWSLKDALTVPVHKKDSSYYDKKDNVYYDHLGNKFSNLAKLLDAYHLPRSTYNSRVRMGMPLKDVLTLPIVDKFGKRGFPTQDPIDKDKWYASKTEMYDYYGTTDRIVWDRTHNQGMDLITALTTPVLEQGKGCRYVKCQDPYGNKFNSKTEMYKYYGINTKLMCARLSAGWSFEKALTTPILPAAITNGCKCYDHLNNEYVSFKQMCRHYSINPSVCRWRIASGLTLEEALTIPKRMYIGEYRVAECLKRLNVKFYHNCSIKTIFEDLEIKVDWDEFLSSLQSHLGSAGINWSKNQIEKLRPDFTLYTDDDNKIRGIIEFDGIQHQNFVEFFFKTIEEFLRRSDVDFVKQDFFEYMNIPMLRIRYDQVDTIDEMVKDFVAHPQSYIHKHNTFLSEEEYWTPLMEQKSKIEMAFAV